MSFSITCTTCQCRLRVRDPSLIGQILACPKCDSMVMVSAPDGQDMHDSPTGETTSVDATATPDASATPEAPATPDASAAPTAQPPDTRARGGRLRAKPLADAEDPMQNQETVDDLDSPLHQARNSPPPVIEAKSSTTRVFRPVDGENEPVLPSEQWMSADTQRRRRMLMIGTGGVAGLLILVVLLVVVFGGKGDDVADQGGNPDDSAKKAKDDESQPGAKKTDDAGKKADPEKGSADKSQQTGGPGAKKTKQDTKKAAPPNVGPNAKDADAKKKKKKKNATVVKKKSDQIKKDGKNSTTTKNPALATKKKPPGFEAKPEAGATPKELSKALGQFAPFMANAAFDPGKRSAELRTTPPRMSMPRPPPRRVDVNRRLTDRLLGVQYRNVPLGSFLRDLSNLSTLPITIDVDAMLARQVTPATPVTVELQATTVADVLKAALTPLQLGYVAEANHVIVTWPPAAALREQSYPVEDLAPDDASAAELLNCVKTLLASESWTDGLAEGPTVRTVNRSLVLNHDHRTHFHLEVLLDKLRLARGLATRSGHRALALLPAKSTQILPKLSKTGEFRFRYDTPLYKILQAIGKAGELDVVIDWQAAAKVGWAPNAESTLMVKDKLLSNAFTNVLDPMDLTIRVVDAKTVEVTTWDKMSTRLDVEAYSVGHLLTPQSADDWLAKLKERLRATTRSSKSRLWRFYYDEKSKHLFARLPQVQQIKLNKIVTPR